MFVREEWNEHVAGREDVTQRSRREGYRGDVQEENTVGQTIKQ